MEIPVLLDSSARAGGVGGGGFVACRHAYIELVAWATSLLGSLFTPSSRAHLLSAGAINIGTSADRKMQPYDHRRSIGSRSRDTEPHFDLRSASIMWPRVHRP